MEMLSKKVGLLLMVAFLFVAICGHSASAMRPFPLSDPISNICIPSPNKETSSLMLESSTSLLVEAIKKKLLTCIDSVIQPMKPLKPTIYI